jgi:hypothetical protein
VSPVVWPCADPRGEGGAHRNPAEIKPDKRVQQTNLGPMQLLPQLQLTAIGYQL